MMEVVGIVTTGVAFLEVTPKVCRLHRRWKQASEEIEQMREKAISLSHDIELLGTAIIPQAFCEDGSPVENFSTWVEQAMAAKIRELKSLQQRLQPITLLNSASKRSRVRWISSHRRTVDELMLQVALAETSITTIAAVLTWHRSQACVRVVRGDNNHVSTVQKCSSRPQGDRSGPEQKTESTEESAQNLSNMLNEEYCTVMESARGRSTASTWGNCFITRSKLAIGPSKTWKIEVSMQTRLLRRRVLKFSTEVGLRQRDRSLRLSFAVGRLALCRFRPMKSAFMVAVRLGDVETIRALLLNGHSSPRDTAEGGVTAMCVAIQHGHIDVVKLLIDSGCDIDEYFGRKKTSAFSWAIRHRQLGICNMLLESNASLSQISVHGWSALFYLWPTAARHETSCDYIRLLKSSAAWNCLHENVFDAAGWGVMRRAAVFGTPEDVGLLLEYGVDAFQRLGDNSWNWLVLHSVVKYGVTDTFHVLYPKYLERFGAKAQELPDRRGYTLLHIAVANGDEKMIRVLLDVGANWEARTGVIEDWGPPSAKGKELFSIGLALEYGEERYLMLCRAIDDYDVDNLSEQWNDANDSIWVDGLEA